MAKKSLTPDEKMCVNLTDKLAADFANGDDAGNKRSPVNTFEIIKEYFDGDRKEMKQAEKFMDNPSDEIVNLFDGLVEDDSGAPKVVPLFPAGAVGIVGREDDAEASVKIVSASRFNTKQGPSIIAVKVWGPSGTSDFALFADEHRGKGWNPIVFKTVRTDRKESLRKQYDNQLTADSWPRPATGLHVE